jgi:hypothetical protein
LFASENQPTPAGNPGSRTTHPNFSILPRFCTPNQMFFKHLHKIAILRACDFFPYRTKTLAVAGRGSYRWKAVPVAQQLPIPWQRSSPIQQPSPICHSERSEESAVRLDPSPIPKGKHTANSNRAYLSPDATVSISGHILFIRSKRLACGKLREE